MSINDYFTHLDLPEFDENLYLASRYGLTNTYINDISIILLEPSKHCVFC